jgi:TolB-like protein
MKNLLRLLTVLFLTVLVCGSLYAKEKKSIAVLPFAMHSQENLDYVKQGIWDMISSRISVSDKVEVLSKDTILGAMKGSAGKDFTMADAYALGKEMNVDYVVFGSITKIGNSLSIDGKLLDIASHQSTAGISTQSQGMDDVISKINDFAQKIDQGIRGIASPAPISSPSVQQAAPVQEKMLQQPLRESAVAAGIRKSKKGTLTSLINPDFINETEPILRKDFVMSPKFPTEFKGIDIGDVNKDGSNETVIIDNRNIMIYQYKDKDFRLLQRIPGAVQDNYLSVDVADINQNGIPEIIVTNLSGVTLESFVLEFRDNKFIPLATKLPLFLRVVETASGQILLGQSRGFERPFDTQIYQIVATGGKYVEGNKMKIPLGLSVYGLAITPLSTGGDEKIIAIDDHDYLTVYEKTDKPLEKLQAFLGSKERLWKSDDIYGGSNNSISTALEYGQTAYGQAQSDSLNRRTFLNPRILSYNPGEGGKKSIIIVKNLSKVGSLFKNVKMYSSSELYDLEWDGLGLYENWKTRKINGYVADYQFKDVDNDGQKEVVLALVLSAGATTADTSVIVFYRMTPKQSD